MRLTKEIQHAVSRLVGMPGWSGTRLARELGVTESAVSRWRSGTCASLTDANWERLRAVLARVLRDDTGLPSASPDSFDVPGCVASFVPVPVLGNAAAAAYEPAVEPLCEYLASCEKDAHMCVEGEVKPGYFCLRVEGTSMEPEFPNGTLLLVAGGEFPETGDIVVARLADHGEVVVKRYHRRQGIVLLSAENPDGQSYSIDLKKEPGRLVWVWPVIHARIPLRDRRRARRAKGGIS